MNELPTQNSFVYMSAARDVALARIRTLSLYSHLGNDFRWWSFSFALSSPLRGLTHLQVVLEREQTTFGHSSSMPRIFFRFSDESHSVPQSTRIFTVNCADRTTMYTIAMAMNSHIPHYSFAGTPRTINHGWINYVMSALVTAELIPGSAISALHRTVTTNLNYYVTPRIQWPPLAGEIVHN